MRALSVPAELELSPVPALKKRDEINGLDPSNIGAQSGTSSVAGNCEENQKRIVLIVDDHEVFAKCLSASFRDAGFEVQFGTSYSTALAAAAEIRPWLTIAEVKLGARWIFDVIEPFRQLGGRIAVATAYPSVATAIRAVREGAVAYLAKPVTATTILSMLAEKLPSDPALVWPSLDRTIWEYINQVLVESGSISEAARRLRLDRRSLRRMLAKYPPMR